MLPKALKSALELLAFNNINATVLVDSNFNIMWQNNRFSELFAKEYSIANLLKQKLADSNIAAEIKKKNKFSMQINLINTAIKYRVDFSPIECEGKIYYTLEFILQEETMGIIENVDMRNIIQTFSFQLRSPISKISNAAESIESNINGKNINSKNFKAKITAIDNSCRQLLRSISNFVDITKYSLGLFELELSLVYVPQFLHNLIKECATQPNANNIPIKFHNKNTTCYTNFDEKKITLAIVNIIVNSCMYTKPGNHIDVYLKTKKEAQTFTITIQDTGVGMDEKTCVNATFPYFTGNSGVNNLPYTQGLGLTLSKYIIELHNGSLKIPSQKGIGTTVEITLPINLSQSPSQVLHSPLPQYIKNKFSIVAIQFAFEVF